MGPGAGALPQYGARGRHRQFKGLLPCGSQSRGKVSEPVYFFYRELEPNRPDSEVAGIMELMSYNLKAVMPEFHENKISIRVIGDRSNLSDKLRREIESAEAETSVYTDNVLILMFSYSGKWDIEQAAERYAKDYGTPEAKPFERYLSTDGIPDPDLLIRTGGEQRISNYMLWQCAYTEFYFTEKLWPDFREDDFNEALDSFKGRDRRYGKVK